MSSEFKDRVALVTGAGNGLGRAYAHALAARGAAVVVNDFGGDREGTGGSRNAAKIVADEIRSEGGSAIADTGSVADPADAEGMVEAALKRFGRLDIVINNAGILRDRSFAKMTIEEFDSVMSVHARGSFLVTRAAWPSLREQQYGRVVFTTSSSGLYGNFGQANYGAAKMAVVGLMNTLRIEGAKYDIRVNALAPTALTRMTEDLGFPDLAREHLKPEAVVPAALFLTGEDAPNGAILAAGAGGFALSSIVETDGIWLGPSDRTAEALRDAWSELAEMSTAEAFSEGGRQGLKFLQKALANTAAE
jgi:NAD(P)-dependent dehydrogenase (short-subunit alcohol dehydrogenase family)